MRRTASILLLVSLLLGLGALVYHHSDRGRVREFLRRREELETVALEALETWESGEERELFGWTVTCWPEQGQVDFQAPGLRPGLSSARRGLCYSAADRPCGFRGVSRDFLPHENGWLWQDGSGDGWQYTERVLPHWFWFEAHF